MDSHAKASLDPQNIANTTTTGNANAPGKETNTSSTPAQAVESFNEAEINKKKVTIPVDAKQVRTEDEIKSVSAPEAGAENPLRYSSMGPGPGVPDGMPGGSHVILSHQGTHDAENSNYMLKDRAKKASTSEDSDALSDVVRAWFGPNGSYNPPSVGIKSKPLREALREVMGEIQSFDLCGETPKLDLDLLFLYLEDFRWHLQSLDSLECEAKTTKERKSMGEWTETKRRHLEVLILLLDKEYAHVKESLHRLLKKGFITLELLWALWKPDTLAYVPSRGNWEGPCVFMVETACRIPLEGSFGYWLDGKYVDQIEKGFAYCKRGASIGPFRGAQKITSLNCYPLAYHKDEAQVRKDLIERGKTFAGLAGGAKHMSYEGLALGVLNTPVNINGRIMVDPNLYRQNKAEFVGRAIHAVAEDSGKEKVVENICPIEQLGRVMSQNDKEPQNDYQGSRDARAISGSKPCIPEFGDEEYLLASPTVWGFAFTEKMWLGFAVSAVKEISWNEQAYDSLVLEPKTKGMVQALVASHKYQQGEGMDDFIQGKGQGLAVLLHGPPGTGKTLTAEAISELLKCPLYSASAGDLGSLPSVMEAELKKAFSLCHSWGAILLLDAADVFLGEHRPGDVYSNAVASVFLRQLEYFQGILFLTTNHVATFDNAFQSRIHLALRYDALDTKARKTIFKRFVERVRILKKLDAMPFTERDYNRLARYSLNGRQIRNTVRTAQALAVSKGEPLSMRHMLEHLDTMKSFERDLTGRFTSTESMVHYS